MHSFGSCTFRTAGLTLGPNDTRREGTTGLSTRTVAGAHVVSQFRRVLGGVASVGNPADGADEWSAHVDLPYDGVFGSW